MNKHEGIDSQGGDSTATLEAVPEDTIRDMVQLFKLLSDETRLRILFFLRRQDELHVRALCELLSQSQPAVSHHLALLRVAGLIEARRDGKHNFYRILPRRFDIVAPLQSERSGINVCGLTGIIYLDPKEVPLIHQIIRERYRIPIPSLENFK